MHNKKYIAIIILTILGIINAFYLSYEAYQIVFATKTSLLGTSICDFNETFSCTSFFNNPRSMIFGIPFPMIAAVVYPILFILSLIAYKTKSRKITMTIMIMALMGFVFNGYVISQEFIVGVFCPLCMMCTGYIALIAILSFLIVKGDSPCKCKGEKVE